MIARSRRSTRASSTIGLRALTQNSGGKLAVRPRDPRKLVEVDLSGHRLPAHPRGPVVFEEQPPAGRDPARELQRRAVEDEEVDTRRQEYVEGARRLWATEEGRDIDVRARPLTPTARLPCR
ncbi:hypothetical protein [Parafrankia sp. EUN1f]|uniref:hypothetical protein n=1 Tax=Parafrankia sp. EUN1f TaxID=102897 RepID=UPI0005650978|nr:hypothetical protein [Parafrankia sp. EUN1f]